MKKIKRYLQSYKEVLLPPYNKADIPIVVITLLVLASMIVVVLQLNQSSNTRSNAATVNTVEPEEGVLAGVAFVADDPNASGGKFVRFGNVSPSSTPTPIACLTSSSSFQNTSIEPQSGQFTLSFSATPAQANMNGVIGLSQSAVTAYSGMAGTVRFGPNGVIDALKRSAYAADASVPYTPGVSYTFRMIMNVPSHTYSVYVTPAGGTEVLLANNYEFRTEQSNVSSLANIGYVSSVGSNTLCNPQVSGVVGNPPTLTPTPTSTIPTPTSGTMTGWPGAHNTGYPHGLPGDTRTPVTLTPYTGPMTITQDGTVLDSVSIDDRGPLTINAKNVVIKNSFIRITNLEGSPNKEAVKTYNSDANLLIMDTELSGLTASGQPSDNSGGGQPLVSRTGYTLLRVNMHHYGDIIRIDGRATVQDSWLHDPQNAGGVDPHNDIIQSTNATYIRIIHNRLDHRVGATQTACILLKADIGSISDVVVDNNLINGGGYSVYWYDAHYRITNGRFSNNRWLRSPTGGIWPKGGYHGPYVSSAAEQPTWINNVWDDNGAPIL